MGGSLSVLETPVLASAAGTKNKADSAGAPSAREAASLVPLPCGKRFVLLWGGAELADGEGGEATQLADVCVRIRCCWMRCGAAATLLGGMQHSWLWATAALLSAYPFG